MVQILLASQTLSNWNSSGTFVFKTLLLVQGTAAVPVSLRLPEAASVQSMQSNDDSSDTFSPTGVRDRGALLHDQVGLSWCPSFILRHCNIWVVSASLCSLDFLQGCSLD